MFRAGVDPGRDRAFADPSVADIAAAIVLEREPKLVTFARLALTMRDASSTIGPTMAGTASSAHAAARRIAAAGVTINALPTEGQRRNLRGAVLERLTFELVRGREPSTMREQQVKLSAAGATPEVWSNPKEVVTDPGDDGVEVYECKWNASDANQGDIDELLAIRAALRRERPDCWPAIVTMEGAGYLKRALRSVRGHDDLYWAAGDELLEIGDGKPYRLFRNL